MSCGMVHVDERTEVLGLDGSPRQSVASIFIRASDLPEGIETVYAVNGLMPVGSRILLAGPPGGGKTLAALGMAMSLTSERPFLEHFSVNESRGILLIDEESGPERLGSRFRRLARGLNLDLGNLPIWVSSMNNIRFDVETAVTRGMILRQAAQTGAQVLIIDSLVRVHQGNENATQDMSRLFAELERLRHTIPNIVIVHHTRKPGLGFTRDSGWSQVRGSGDIMAWCDCAYFVEARGQNIHRVECLKFRDGPMPEPFEFVMEGDPPEPLRLIYRGQAIPILTRLQETCQEILNLLSDGGEWRRRRIAEALPNLEDKTITRALGELVDGGRIERVQRGVYRVIRQQDESNLEVDPNAF